MGQKLCENDSNIGLNLSQKGSKRYKKRPGAPKLEADGHQGSFRGKNGAKRSQEEPRVRPTWPQMVPRWPKITPRGAQDNPKNTLEEPTGHSREPNGPPKAYKMDQVGTQRVPKKSR